MTEIKINSINSFINKFNITDEIFDLRKLKTKFDLDLGEKGFYQLSLSQKIIYGTDKTTETYYRPPIGPLPKGTYCKYCMQVSPEDHLEDCPHPKETSLNLTLFGFNNFILRNTAYDGKYLRLKQSFLERALIQQDADNILLIEGQLKVESGSIGNIEDSVIKTKIPYMDVIKKRGPEKLAPKTATTQFLNTIIISYSDDNVNSSIRISKNGLINIVNAPKNKNHRDELFEKLIKRINKSKATIIENLRIFLGEEVTEYLLIPEFSYIHSAKAQFSLWIPPDKYELNYSFLDTLISPFNSKGEIIPGKYTTIKQIDNKQVIFLGKLLIIEWEYILSKETRQQTMSKEYIKFICIPRVGIKLTVLIHKHGSFQMTLSYCNTKDIFCKKNANTIIDTSDFNIVRTEFMKVFEGSKNQLIRESLLATSSTTLNTVDGYSFPYKLGTNTFVCRANLKRTSGGVTWYEKKTPEPYSWQGQCSDPNYQYIAPGGILGDNNLWYPCCASHNDKSRALMKYYLRNGFPSTEEEAKIYNTAPFNDPGSGILIPGSNIPGNKAMVFIDSKFQPVIVDKKLGKAANEYLVTLENGKQTKVSGTQFLRDSRPFPGLKSFSKDQLLSCIRHYLKANNMYVNNRGHLKSIKFPFPIKKNKELQNKFNSLISINFNVQKLVFSDFNLFERLQYNITGVPDNTYHFYLVLTPDIKFYINQNNNIIDSGITTKIDNVMILEGFLRINDAEVREFYIVDILYYQENISHKSFIEREKILNRLSLSLETDVSQYSTNTDILIFSEYQENIIEGASNILNDDQNTMLIFMPINQGCCNYLIWDPKQDYDTIQFQIINKNSNVVDLGYENNVLISNYIIPPPVPNGIVVNQYWLWKINKTIEGKLVPNRYLKPIKQVEKPEMSYEQMYKSFQLILSPIDIYFFIDSNTWSLPDGKILISSDGILKSV